MLILIVESDDIKKLGSALSVLASEKLKAQRVIFLLSLS